MEPEWLPRRVIQRADWNPDATNIDFDPEPPGEQLRGQT